MVRFGVRCFFRVDRELEDFNWIGLDRMTYCDDVEAEYYWDR